MLSFEKILVPVDGSEFAETALEPALAIARAVAAEVELFRVAEPIPATREFMRVPDLYNEFVVEAYREARDYLKNLRAQLAYDRASIHAKRASEGITRQIVDYAAENSVDLIVMSSHGRSGVSRWACGSVAAKVLSGAFCATMIIRGLQTQ